MSRFHLLCTAPLLVAIGACQLPGSPPPDNSSSDGPDLVTEGTASDLPMQPVDAMQPIDEANLQCDITPAIAWIADQEIPYTQTPADEWRDCSGNFLRLSSRIATLCPAITMPAPPGVSRYVKGQDNKRPGKAAARTTRGLAKWYDERGLFTPIYYSGSGIEEAPGVLVEERNRIRPGTVLWFSRSGVSETAGTRALYDEATGIINHMGTVVSIKKDDAGNVTEWEMYHGQNEKKNNGITRHWWSWPDFLTSRGQKYPPGGYWDQRIVGIAENIVPQ